MKMVKFNGKEYPGSLTVSELAKQLEVEGAYYCVSVKEPEYTGPSAQELIDEI